MLAGYAPAERRRLLEALIARRRAGETFKAICATPGWPSRPTLRKWLRRAPDGFAACVPALRAPPVRWSAALACDICNWVAMGVPLRVLCTFPHMPDRKTLDAWCRRHPDFAQALALARAATGYAPTGRPSTYSPAIADKICLALCHGEYLTTMCDQPGYPAPRTVRDWARAHPDFAHAFDIARQMQGDARAERAGFTFAKVEAWVKAARARTAKAAKTTPR